MVTSSVEAIEFLGQFMTDRRKSLIDQVLDNRTRHLTVVLEDVYKPQNASAVLRTCECQGIQDLHIIENKHLYEVNPDVVKGAAKWLTLFKYPKSGKDNSIECLNELRNKGYHIVAADPKGRKLVSEIDIESKVAIVFGTEYHGLSDTAKNLCDELVRIPMSGFTESYNLSVSAAICIETLTSKFRNSSINWKLSVEEKEVLKLEWYKNQVRDAEALLMRQFG